MPDDLQQLLSLLDPRPLANTLWQNRGLLNPAPLVQGVGNVGRRGGAALADMLAGQDTTPIPYDPQDHINAMRGIAIDHANAMKEIAREGEPPMGGQHSSLLAESEAILPPDIMASEQLVNLGPGRPSQPAIQQHRGAIAPPAQAAGAATGRPMPGGGQVAGVPDLATALRQLVQVAQTPQHPDQQTALRQLVALLHHALGGGQGAGQTPQ